MDETAAREVFDGLQALDERGPLDPIPGVFSEIQKPQPDMIPSTVLHEVLKVDEGHQIPVKCAFRHVVVGAIETADMALITTL